MIVRRILFHSSLCLALLLLVCSCSTGKALRSAERKLLTEKVIQSSHLGIAVYDVSAEKLIYDYQSDKYFVPASNTKIPTCYAAMKYLGDSITTFQYSIKGKDTILISGQAAPDFLHPDYSSQSALEFLRQFRYVVLLSQSYKNYLGSGWAWSDYKEYYMAQRSELPVYGNVASFKWETENELTVQPSFFSKDINLQTPLKNGFEIDKTFDQNTFTLSDGNNKSAEVPFNPYINTIAGLLRDTLKLDVLVSDNAMPEGALRFRSRPVDSVLRPMMHRSDNFFAEQMLLMVSKQQLGTVNDAYIIDTLLKTDFSLLPQKPRWVDGSGLSRYNLFTPQDFVFILNKMQKEFGMARIKNIFPTGGKGTLASYYQEEAGQLFAKTGTLSGVVALSGFLYTKRGKLLLFSVLVNNHNGSATDVRRSVEKFIRSLRELK